MSSYKNTLRQKLETVFAEMATELPEQHEAKMGFIFDDLGLRVSRQVKQTDENGDDILDENGDPIKVDETLKTNTANRKNKAMARWLVDKVVSIAQEGNRKRKYKKADEEMKAEDDK